MALQDADFGASARLPQPDGLVKGGRDDLLAVRAEIRPDDRAGVSFQSRQLLSRGRVPHAGGAVRVIAEGRNQAAAVGAEIHRVRLVAVQVSVVPAAGRSQREP